MDVMKGEKGDNCREKTARMEKWKGITAHDVQQYVNYPYLKYVEFVFILCIIFVEFVFNKSV